MKHYKVTLTYTINPTHPDFNCLTDWTPDKIYTDTDVYHIDEDYFFGDDDIKDYMMEDMLSTAGGGYDWKGIDNASFSVEEIAS